MLTLHDAAELFLVLAAEATGAAVKSNAALLEYWTPIDDRIAPSHLGYRAAMKAVSDARRTLKHSGVMPAKSEVQRLAANTREFLADGSRVVFDADLDAFTMTDILPAGPARDALKKAEAAIAQGDEKEALNQAGIGLAHALRDQHGPSPTTDPIAKARAGTLRLQRERRSSKAAFFLKLEDKVDRAFAEAWDELSESAQRSEAAAFALVNGLDYDSYRMFKALTPGVFFPDGRPEPIATSDGNRTPTMDEARWCTDFAVNAVVALQMRTA